jgi:hypothetical protein
MARKVFSHAVQAAGHLAGVATAQGILAPLDPVGQPGVAQRRRIHTQAPFHQPAYFLSGDDYIPDHPPHQMWIKQSIPRNESRSLSDASKWKPHTLT